MTRTKFILENTVRRLIGYDGSCCISCHEDADEWGYALCWLDLGDGREAEVCCAVANYYKEWLKVGVGK